MTEAEFESQFRETLLYIEDTIEVAIEQDDVPVDYETVNDILNLDFEDGSTIVITKQTATRQLWVAARSGGFHYNYLEDAPNQDKWLCTTQAKSLFEMLSSFIAEQGKVSIEFMPS